MNIAKLKCEEKKDKGVNVEDGFENPDIVPLEDNDKEEESFGQVSGLVAQGRGRGRGVMWPPNMAMGCGDRPLPRMLDFSPSMMGVDGFTYGAGPNGFPIPDPFSIGPRPFVPYGPRFSDDFGAQAPSMKFHDRPSQLKAVLHGSGFGMIMGVGRSPFMGGMGMGAGAPYICTTLTEYLDQGKGQDIGSCDGNGRENAQYQQGLKGQGRDKFGVTNSLRNEDSDSEDEAPRRSRHGKGK
ncbi:hypothetical protein Ancab_021432 [Ancistrocladus abbreviatus]